MIRRLVLVTLIALGTASPVAAGGPAAHRCGTPSLLRAGPIPPRAAQVPALLGPAGQKLTRDGFGGGFQQHLSTNFAIKWTDPSVTVAQAQIVADALELAWSKYIDDLGHDPCTGCTTYRLNAYIARAQDNPGIDFSGGYAYVDNEGYPYFVISRAIFAEGDAMATIRAVSVHEFYHDIQFSTGAFEWGATQYGWFWEATAEWASMEALPGTGDPFVFSGPFALTSELPLYYYGDPFGEDQVTGVRQYGAGIFFRHVTDTLGAPGVIVNTWEDSSASAEPLAAMAAQLPSRDLVTLHTEFAAKNAIWDYAYRQFIISSIGLYKGAFPDMTEIQGFVPPQGIGLTTLPRSPYGFGYATIELRRPPTGRFKIDAQLTPGSVPAELHGTVVYGEPGAATYTPLEVTGTTGTLTMDVPESAVRLYLVLSTTTDERLTGQAIPLAYAVTPVAPVEEPAPGDEMGGCCQTGSGPSGSAVVLGGVVLLVLRRRRRGTHRAS